MNKNLFNLLRITFGLILLAVIVLLSSLNYNHPTEDYAVAEDELQHYLPYKIDNQNVILANNYLTEYDDTMLSVVELEDSIIILCQTDSPTESYISLLTIDSQCNLIDNKKIADGKVIDSIVINQSIYAIIFNTSYKLYHITQDYITYLHDTTASQLISMYDNLVEVDSITNSLVSSTSTRSLEVDFDKVTAVVNSSLILQSQDNIVIYDTQSDTIVITFEQAEFVSTQLFEDCYFLSAKVDEYIIVTKLDYTHNIIFTYADVCEDITKVDILVSDIGYSILICNSIEPIQWNLCRHGDLISQNSSLPSNAKLLIDHTNNIYWTYAGNLATGSTVINGNEIGDCYFSVNKKIIVVSTKANMNDYETNFGQRDIFVFLIK